jgi:FMN reductase
MSDVLTIAGSPSAPSRSTAVLDYVRRQLEASHLTTATIQVRNLPAESLLWARIDDPAIQTAIQSIEQARAIVIATPVYKAAYSGILKAFLDLLPQRAFADKIIFPIATAGSSSHLLAIDYAVKPVLSALGAQHILNGLYIQDSQLQYKEGFQLDSAVNERLLLTLDSLIVQLARPETLFANGK